MLRAMEFKRIGRFTEPIHAKPTTTASPFGIPKCVGQHIDTVGGSIFIVDDDDGARVGLERLLVAHGYRTKAFDSAKAFLNRLPIDDEACLILEQYMPKMTGMELLDELSRRQFDIPIVFLTVDSEIPTGAETIKHGSVNFLPKLAEEEVLIDAIERSLARSRESIGRAALGKLRMSSYHTPMSSAS